MIDKMKLAKTAPLPMKVTKLFESTFRPKPLIKNPMNGIKGINHIYCSILNLLNDLTH